MNHQATRQILLDTRTELEERIGRTHRHIFHKDAPVSANFHEQVVETGNDVLVQVLDEEARQEIQQINQALQRMDDGVYELCQQCGGQIGEQRLVAIPYTDMCITCASAVQANTK